MCTGLGVVIMENKKGAKRIISLVLSAAMLLSIFISPETFADTYIDEDGYTIEDPIKGNTIEYTDPATDEKGNYPTNNDGNVYEDITVVNPDTGVTSPSLSGIGEDPISQNRTMEYNDVWLTKYIKEVDKQGKSEINLRVEAHEFNRPMDIVLVIDNSNSMDVVENGEKRVDAAKKAAKNFIDEFSGFAGSDKVGIALVTYGSDIFDGKEVFSSGMSLDASAAESNVYYRKSNMSQYKTGKPYRDRLEYVWGFQDLYERYGPTSEMATNTSHTVDEFKYSDADKEKLKSSIPSNVPRDRGMEIAGGTFTQKALRRAQKIIRENGNDDARKIIILLTDGAPTFAFKAETVKESPGEIIDYADPENIMYDNMIVDTFYEEPARYNEDNYIHYVSGNSDRLHLGERTLYPSKTFKSTGVRRLYYYDYYGNEYYEYKSGFEKETDVINFQGDKGVFSWPKPSLAKNFREAFFEDNGREPTDEEYLNFTYNGEHYTYLTDKQYDTTDGYTVVDNAFATISEAIKIRSEETEIFTVGVALKDGPIRDPKTITTNFGTGTLSMKESQFVPRSTERELGNIMKNISGSEENYFPADNAKEIETKFAELGEYIRTAVPTGKVTDPIGAYFNLDINGEGDPVVISLD